MPKPRQISDALITTVVFTFLKKALDTFTGDQGEGKKKITKKASIAQGKAQGSAAGKLSKDNVESVINDPNNFKRLKEKAKKILQEGKVKPTNNTAADRLLDVYIQDTRELRNFTELDQGVDQIFTDTFLDGLRNRQAVGISRYGEIEEDEQPQPEEDEQPKPEEDDEPAPVPSKKPKSTKKKRKVPKLIQPEAEEEKPTEEEMPKEQISVPLMEQLKQNVSDPLMSNGTGIGLSMEELTALRSKSGKLVRKVPKMKASKATDRAKLEEAVASVLKQEQISTKKNVTTGFEEMGQRLDDINTLLSSRPELKQIHADVVKQLEREGYDVKRSDTKLQGLGLNKKIVDELIKTIPEQNRDILAPAVRSIAGSGGVNMNNIVAGLVGLGMSLSGNPTIGMAVTPIISGMMNKYGVDLNQYFDVGQIIDEPEKEEKEKEEEKLTGVLSEEEEIKINEDVYEVISGVVEEAQPQASPESKRNYIIDSLLSLPETIKRKISEIRRKNPTEPPSQILRDVTVDYDVDEDLELGGITPSRAPSRTTPYSGVAESVVQGAGTGALYGGVASGVSTGSAQGAISGMIPGAIAGGIAGLTSEQLLRRYYRSQGIPMNPDLNRRIKALSALPAAAVAAYLGYTPSGKVEDVVGTGVTSGAGITEKKISVDPSVLEKTQAQLEQEKGKIKVWEPKVIVPSTDILDESKQEKYIDDVEFIAFNYIPPTSEGSQGTVDTNPLKYQQLLESNIRYTDAGVYIPYITWNKINDANNMTPQQLKTKMLGPELPRMKFNTFDNDTTFENVAKWQYVNNENTAVEYLSPYSDFSNVENSWWSNPTSELFTINP